MVAPLFRRRLAVGIACALATVSVAACGGGDPLTGSGTAVGSSARASNPVASEPGAPPTATAGASAFCAAYDFGAVTNAVNDPEKARDVFKDVAEVAPSELRADARFLYRVFDGAIKGEAYSGSAAQVRDASARVAAYYARNCD